MQEIVPLSRMYYLLTALLKIASITSLCISTIVSSRKFKMSPPIIAYHGSLHCSDPIGTTLKREDSGKLIAVRTKPRGYVCPCVQELRHFIRETAWEAEIVDSSMSHEYLVINIKEGWESRNGYLEELQNLIKTIGDTNIPGRHLEITIPNEDRSRLLWVITINDKYNGKCEGFSFRLDKSPDSLCSYLKELQKLIWDITNSESFKKKDTRFYWAKQVQVMDTAMPFIIDFLQLPTMVWERLVTAHEGSGFGPVEIELGGETMSLPRLRSVCSLRMATLDMLKIYGERLKHEEEKRIDNVKDVIYYILKFATKRLFKKHGFRDIEQVFKADQYPLDPLDQSYPQELRDEIQKIDSKIEREELSIDPFINNFLPC